MYPSVDVWLMSIIHYCGTSCYVWEYRATTTILRCRRYGRRDGVMGMQTLTQGRRSTELPASACSRWLKGSHTGESGTAEMEPGAWRRGERTGQIVSKLKFLRQDDVPVGQRRGSILGALLPEDDASGDLEIFDGPVYGNMGKQREVSVFI